MSCAYTNRVRLAKHVVFVALFVLVGLFNSPVHAAALLDLTLEDIPDILAQFILVEYDSGTNVLTASGTAVDFDNNGAAEQITDGTFDLIALIDDVGFTSGSVSIGGTISNLGFNSGTLLTGNLTDGGTPDPGGTSEQLHFTFDVTGGDAAGIYANTGTGIGGIVMSSTGFPGDFSADFNNALAPGLGDGSANIGVVVPEPTSLSIFCVLWASLLAYRRSPRLATLS